jgi:starch synthase
LFDRGWISELGLPSSLVSVDGLEFWQRVSLLKGGINFADRLTTVSPRYALEIQQPMLGFGFEGIVRGRADVLTGIVNGIDTDAWDPARDPFLPKGYTAATLDDKMASKRAVLERFGLPVDEVSLARPLVAMVSRMVDQKGLDLIATISPELPHLGASIVVAGTGEPAYERMWQHLAETSPDRIGLHVGYDEALAHLVTAGSDLWLMPSQFEPCGLSQMYSQRYGTLPLVRATGGLDDTVENCDPASGTGTGFKFHDYLPSALLNTLRWALSVYGTREAWRRMQQAAMKKDFSWARSARAYAEVYRLARARRRAVVASV